MKSIIFVPSTSIFRGPMLAPKAGFFYSNAKGFHLPIKRRPVFTERLRNVFARESGLVDSGIRQAAFLSAYKVNKSHVFPRRNSYTLRKGTPDHSGQIAAPRGGSLATTARPAPRFYSTKARAFGADKTPIINSISVT